MEACLTRSWCDELMFGGARGGGKSDFLLGDYLSDVHEFGHAWRGILFRRTFPQLEELINRSREIYPNAYPGATFKEQSKTWHFPNRAFLRMRSLEREADADNYIGHQYTWVGFDQLETWPTANAYIKLIGCLRSAFGVPVKRIRSSANPGGIGHVWVKDRFVKPAKKGWKPIEDPVTKMTRMFIPSVLTDNKILIDNDPYYADRLRAMSGVSQALVEAWLNGDWDVIAGAYFDVFGAHLIHPHAEVMNMIQPWSPRWLGIDWGFKHATTCYWNAQEGIKTLTYDELVISGQSPKDLAEMIAARCQGQKIDEIHLSHDAFAKKTDADSIAEQMSEEFQKWGLPSAERASTDRIGGAQLLYKLFKMGLVLISDKCPTLADTIPAIVHDPDHQEQTLKMDGDDSYDGYRYGLYGRLGPKPKPLEVMISEAITSSDPTVRHIQALLAQQKYRQSETTGVQTFSRKASGRPLSSR